MTPDQKPAREWPGNKIECSGENLKIHDELCDILEEMGWTATEVVNASVGIWGALKVMRDKLDEAKAEIERLRGENEYVKSQSDARWANLYEREKQINELKRDIAVVVEALGMVDAVGMPSPYDMHVRDALTRIKERLEKKDE